MDENDNPEQGGVETPEVPEPKEEEIVTPAVTTPPTIVAPPVESAQHLTIDTRSHVTEVDRAYGRR